MAQEPLLASLRPTVAAGERLRTQLVLDLRQCQRVQEAGLRLKLLMFYRQAFVRVASALSRPLPPGPQATQVLHGAIRGSALVQLWLRRETGRPH